MFLAYTILIKQYTLLIPNIILIKSINSISICTESELKKFITICDIDKLVYNNITKKILTENTDYDVYSASNYSCSSDKKWINEMYFYFINISSQRNITNLYVIDMAIIRTVAYLENKIDDVENL